MIPSDSLASALTSSEKFCQGRFSFGISNRLNTFSRPITLHRNTMQTKILDILSSALTNE